MLLGLCGEKGDGKTTVASHLARSYYQVELHSFAATLKTFTQRLLELPSEAVNGTQAEKERPTKWGPSGREWMKRVGQNMKAVYGQNFFVDLVMREVDLYPNVVHLITDVRFPQEALAVRARGGLLIRVRNPNRSTEFDVDHDETERLDAIACPKEVSGGSLTALLRAVDDLVLPLGLVSRTSYKGEF